MSNETGQKYPPSIALKTYRHADELKQLSTRGHLLQPFYCGSGGFVWTNCILKLYKFDVMTHPIRSRVRIVFYEPTSFIDILFSRFFQHINMEKWVKYRDFLNQRLGLCIFHPTIVWNNQVISNDYFPFPITNYFPSPYFSLYF